MITTPRDSRRSGAAACVTKNVPLAVAPSAASQSASVTSSTDFGAKPSDAPLTRRSRPPISSGATNADVSIWAQPFGQASYVKVADLKTATGGNYDWSTVPQVLTNYQARWGGRSSAIIGIGVRPRVTLIRRAPWFVTSVKAGRSFAGRWVYVQRKSVLGQWVNRKKVRLGSSGARRFRMNLPRGRNILRMFLTTNQAGSGYIWSHSRTIVVRKR